MSATGSRLWVASLVPVKIGEVYHRGRKLRIEPERGLVLALCIRGEPAARIKISERCVCFWPIGIETLITFDGSLRWEVVRYEINLTPQTKKPVASRVFE
jgi:hypothetical protein